MSKMEEQIILRCGSELKKWLEEDADHYGRTVAQSVRFYLEEEKRAQEDELQYMQEEGLENS